MSDNTNDPLDHLFRQKLSAPGYNGPMGDWPSLEKQVQAHFVKERRRRRFIFFFCATIVTGGLAVLMLSPGKEVTSGENRLSNFTNQPVRSAEDSQRSPESIQEHATNNDVISPPVNTSAKTSISKPAMQSGNIAVSKSKKKDPVKANGNETASQFTSSFKTQEVSTTAIGKSSILTDSPASVSETPKQSKTSNKRTEPVQDPEETEEAKEDFIWVDLHAGMNRTSAHLSGDTRQPGYFQKRRQEEKAGLHPAYGVNIRIKKNRFVGQFGVDIMKYGEEVNYSDKATKRFYTVSGGQFVHNDSMVTSPSYEADTKNKFTYIEFPLYAGYEFPTRSKVGWSVMGGISMGFLTNSTATYLDTALTGAFVFENQKKENFRAQTFSVGIQPSLEYRMRSFSELYIAFPVRYHLTSVNHMDASAKQRYLSAGIRLGWRIYVSGQ